MSTQGKTGGIEKRMGFRVMIMLFDFLRFVVRLTEEKTFIMSVASLSISLMMSGFMLWRRAMMMTSSAYLTVERSGDSDFMLPIMTQKSRGRGTDPPLRMSKTDEPRRSRLLQEAKATSRALSLYALVSER